jgi:hypothetical protein
MSSSKIPISTNRMCQPSTIAQTILTLLCDSANIPRPKFFARAFSATRRPPKNWTQACRHPVPTRGVGLFVGRQEVRGSRLVSETHAFNRPPERNNFSTIGSGRPPRCRPDVGSQPACKAHRDYRSESVRSAKQGFANFENSRRIGVAPVSHPCTCAPKRCELRRAAR